jgi:hypothetical protein
MAEAVQNVQTEALKLPERDRAELARELLLSLGGAAEQEAELAWAEEAERRYQELKAGAVQVIRSERVLEEAGSRLR